MTKSAIRAAFAAGVLAALVACAPPSEAPSVAPGTLVQIDSASSQFVGARPVTIWLPPGYETDADARYPVIYLQDGQNLFDPEATAFGEWGVDEAMAQLIAENKIRPAIIVGVWNTALRFEEYMPQKAVRGEAVATGVDAYESFPANTIISDNYLRFLVDELKPYIDKTYRTRTGAGDTFIMGSSMGGLISAYAASEYPQVFGAAACLSTHWPAGDGAVIDYLDAHLPPPDGHRFYFDYGTETLDAAYEPYQMRMDAVMEARGYRRGVDWETRKFDGAPHNEIAWRARVHIPLQFLLGEAAE